MSLDARQIVALIVAAILGVIGLIHVYWAFTLKRGLGGLVPEIDGKPALRPTMTNTLLVALAVFASAVIVLIHAGIVPLRGLVFSWASWMLAAVFIARAIGDFRLVGFFKRVRASRFARLDTLYFSPLCLALGVALLWLAWK